MTIALPMILPEPANDRRSRKPSGQKAPLCDLATWFQRGRERVGGQ